MYILVMEDESKKEKNTLLKLNLRWRRAALLKRNFFFFFFFFFFFATEKKSWTALKKKWTQRWKMVRALIRWIGYFYWRYWQWLPSKQQQQKKQKKPLLGNFGSLFKKDGTSSHGYRDWQVWPNLCLNSRQV